ncbi:hypothetical protein SFRURICE_009915 [Spodoptera frugiperda]|nr:hypothetical protein SFRURICE_009915 [Spodoptera frugiperda]
MTNLSHVNVIHLSSASVPSALPCLAAARHPGYDAALSTMSCLPLLSPKEQAEVHIMACNVTAQCTPTFHNLFCKSHVISVEPIAYCHIPSTIPDSVLLLRNFQKTEKSPAILCPNRESNPLPGSRTCNHSANEANLNFKTIQIPLQPRK